MPKNRKQIDCRSIEFVVGNLNRIGGVSTHVNRLIAKLKNEGIPYIISSYPESGSKLLENVYKIWWFIKFILKMNDNIVHFHKSFGFPQYIYWFLYSWINSDRVIITLHNSSLLGYSRFKLKIALKLLKRTRYLKLLVVSDRIYDLLMSQKIICNYIPTYIPPISYNKIDINSEKKLFMYSVFIGTKANLFNVYGFDIALKLLKEYRSEFKMVFMVGNKDRSDVEYIEQVINNEGLKNDIQIIYNKSLVSYIENCEFLLRPNRIDGYGISLQEALDQDVIAVSSNVCKRPKGTITYNSFKDLVDIVHKILKISNLERFEILKQKEKLDSSVELVEIYNKLI